MSEAVQQRGDVLSHPAPAYSPDEAVELARQHFAVTGRVSPLASERDQNFKLCCDDGRAFVLKIANAAENPAVLDFQTRALLHIARVDPGLPIPAVIPTVGGAASLSVEHLGEAHIVRMLSFIDGTPIGEVGVTAAMRRRLGQTSARLGRALRGYFHPAAGHELLWDLQHLLRLRRLLPAIESPQRRALAERGFERFERLVAPQLPQLRAQVIHNDCNRDNVIVDAGSGEITGLIDFGDMLHGPLVCDLAVTTAYQLIGVDDPIAAAADIVRAYDGVAPLEPAELALLPTLVASRLLASAVICEWRGREHPDNREYILGENDAVWASLARFETLDRHAIGAAFNGVAAGAPPASNAALIERRRRRLGQSLRLFYDEPLHIVRGDGVWLYDADGHAFLDAYNNVAQIGHCHPAVSAALAVQARQLNTNTRYLHERIVEYAERLATWLPGELGVCLFVCTGSEANDLALQLARCHTGHDGAVVTDQAYHGNTIAVRQLSPEETPVEQRAPWIEVVAAPDTYRGCNTWAVEVRSACSRLAGRGVGTAALFIDTIFASDGIYAPPEAAVADAFAAVRAAGGLCVADEVQAGLGRCGPHRWGFEQYGVVPDIVTLGKPMGNGHPLAAVVTTAAIAASFAGQQSYFNTFGGNPVSAAVGLAVLDVIDGEGLIANAAGAGRYLRRGLGALAERHSAIGDVRGAGLFLGVELVIDRAARLPASGAARRVMNAMRRRGVLVGTTGRYDHIIKMRPPLVLQREQADLLIETLDEALHETR